MQARASFKHKTEQELRGFLRPRLQILLPAGLANLSSSMFLRGVPHKNPTNVGYAFRLARLSYKQHSTTRVLNKRGLFLQA
jgi:hypothetical protein